MALSQVVDGDERVTTVGPSAVGRNADAGMESTGGKVTLTISEAKERLKARKIKSRKVKTVMQQQKEEEEEQQLNNQGHYQYNKKTDNIFRDESQSAVFVLLFPILFPICFNILFVNGVTDVMISRRGSGGGEETHPADG